MVELAKESEGGNVGEFGRDWFESCEFDYFSCHLRRSASVLDVKLFLQWGF